jgi:hypothetical protein
MSDAGATTADQRRLRLIAVGCAVAALVIAIVTAVVVVSRSGTSERVATAIEDHQVAAKDIAQISPKTAEVVRDAGFARGARIVDPVLAQALSLGSADVITAISGLSIRSEHDLRNFALKLNLVPATTLYVELERGHRKVLARWSIDGDLRSALHPGSLSLLAVPPPPLPPWPGVTTQPDVDLQLDTINKIDDTHYEIPRSTFEHVFTNTPQVSRSVRIVPAMQNGVVTGMQLFAIRPTSLPAKLGFMNGDTVRGINGDALTTPDQALGVYVKARSVNAFTIELERRGQPVFLHIVIK